MPSARPPLSRDRVVAEAMALADEQGLAALSMRALAGRLGVEAMSLYHHVAGKEALLDAMVDAVFGELHLPVVGGDWRAELRARSVSGRAVLLRHRWAVGLMDSRRTPGPQNLRHHDAVLGCLAAQGFSLVAAGTAFALLDAHLYGFMQQEVSLPFEGEADLAALGAELLGPGGARRLPPLHRLRRGPGPAARLLVRRRVRGDPRPGARGAGRAAGRRAEAPARDRHPRPAAGAAIEVTVPVLGVDGCPGGWVGAVLVPGAPRPRVVVAPDHRAARRDGARRPRHAGGRHRHPDRVAGQHDPTGRRAGPPRAARAGQLGVHHAHQVRPTSPPTAQRRMP